MSSIIFTLVGLDGEVVPFTSFKIEAAAPDGVYDPLYVVPAPVIITTDAEGVATVELEATTAPYFITRLSGTIDDFIALKFFVPESTIPIQAEMLYVDLAKHQKLHTDRALYALIETKVAMLHALNLSQLNQGVASVNGFGGTVVLDAGDVGADPAGTGISTSAAAIAAHSGATDPHGDRAYAESLVVGLWDDRGNYDASVNAYPSSGGSGTAGAILKGDIWTISVGGTLPTAQAVGVGDTVRALIDTPGNTQANWAIQEQNIGYTPENSSNKSTSTSLGSSDTLYPTQKAVKGYVDTSIAALNTPSSMASLITRGQKFGNHSYVGYTLPLDGPYKGSTDGSTPLVSVGLVEALTNRGNIADCTCWEMNSNTINTATQVALYAYAGSSIYPQQQWRTGAKMQFLASLALYNVIPTAENFVYRIGLANGANDDHRSANPWAGPNVLTGNEHTGCAAMFIADNTSIYWQCKSGRKTDVQTTVTTVPYVIGEFAVFHIVVTTTGAVEFRINGTLVATHSGTGVIPDGAYLTEGVAVRNIAATTTAKKGFYLDEFQFKLTLPSARTGFVFT